MEAIEKLGFLGTLLPLVVVVFIIAIGVVLLNQQFQKRLIGQRLEQEQRENQHQQELLRTSIEAQEAERRRIARDMHDEVGAALSIGRMQLRKLEGSHEPGALAGIRETLESALASTRRISHELMPAHLLDLGLEKSLRDLASRTQKASGIQVELTVHGALSDLSKELVLGVYRMCSELLNNGLKHAEAKMMVITLESRGGMLHGRYADDGRGLPEQQQNPGIGLKNIEGRVKALGGNWHYGNRQSGGFEAQFELPILPSKTA